jgi:hypothetical protein
MKKKTVDHTIDLLSEVREHAPSLLEERASLLPFNDLIESEQAGPQKGAKDYDPKEEPYFYIDIGGPGYDGAYPGARVTKDSVTMYLCEIVPGKGKQGPTREAIDVWETTLEGLWEYLRQLPRPPYAFGPRSFRHSSNGTDS